MQDQVQYLNGLGLKAIPLTEHSEDDIIKRVMNGECSLVYESPESFLSKDAWRDVFSTSFFKTHLIGVAKDEEHCISHCYVTMQLLNVHVSLKMVRFVRVNRLT